MTEPSPPLSEMPAVPVPATDVVKTRGRRLLVGAVGLLVALILIAAVAFHGKNPAPTHYIAVSMILFVTGALGVLVRRNAIVLFMCIELMLNAVNLAFATFARMYGTVDGHIMVLFVMIVAAAEVAIGLAIIVSIFRRQRSANVDDLSLLKW